MGSSAKLRIVVAVILCLAGAVVSGVLLGQHHGEAWAVSAVKGACGDSQSQTSGCEEVARSSWSSFAGIPVAAYGLVFYLSLVILLILAICAAPAWRDLFAKAAMFLLVLGLLIDLFLLGVQALSIHAYCELCIWTYVLSAAALFALFPARKAALKEAVATFKPEGRLAVAGWVLGSLAIMASVFGFDGMLRARAEYRQSTLLGKLTPAADFSPAAPAPAITPPPVVASPAVVDNTPAAKVPAPASAARSSKETQDPEYWQKQAKKLEETLEDPTKVEAYYTQKALREYNTATPVSINLENTPSKGFSGAPVIVVEYSDFMCPYCRQLAGALSRFVPDSNGRVILYFKNYPLDKNCNDKLMGSTHPGACNLALGSICANFQGKFEAFHDRAFNTEFRDPQPADVVRIAGEAGLDTAAMQSCLDDPKAKAVLASQIAEANRLGVHSTPTVYIDSKKLPRVADFLTIVDQEARKKGFKPLGQ